MADRSAKPNEPVTGSAYCHEPPSRSRASRLQSHMQRLGLHSDHMGHSQVRKATAVSATSDELTRLASALPPSPWPSTLTVPLLRASLIGQQVELGVEPPTTNSYAHPNGFA